MCSTQAVVAIRLVKIKPWPFSIRTSQNNVGTPSPRNTAVGNVSVERVRILGNAYPDNDLEMEIRFGYEGPPPEFPHLSNEADVAHSGDIMGENGRQ